MTVRPGSPAHAGGRERRRPAAAGRPTTGLSRALVIRVAAVIVSGMALLALTTAFVPADPTIGAPWADLGQPLATLVGAMFWAALTLLSSSVSAELPEGARIVWVLAPLVATMSLGGPLVAAWVAAIATTEPRELRGGVPWYGVLNNHAQFVVSAVLGATVMGVVRLLAATGPGHPLTDLVATIAGAVAFECSNVALTLMVVRTGRWRTVLTSLLSRSFVGADGAQVAVGWLMAQAYIATAWWTPLVFILPALLAWQAIDRDRLRWAAAHDALTELGNRREFGDRLARAVADARRAGEPSVLLVVDLDDFKTINDRFGHAAGDTVLRVTAGRLREATRAEDHVGRLGGDEFAIILSGVPRNAAGPMVSRLQAALTAPIAIEGATVTVGASIGVAAVAGSPSDPEELLRQADMALLEAKGRRRAMAELAPLIAGPGNGAPGAPG
jgi:diguanylate cyclase (GGDEF)-like protein